MELMSYLHSNNIYYGDFKLENLLVFLNYKIKIGDFGTAIKTTSKNENFYLRGCTKDYSLSEIVEKFKKN